MRKAIASLAVLLTAATGLVQLGAAGSASAAAAQGQSGPGVTAKTIKVGITYPDVAAIRNLINVDPGNYPDAYNALIKQINAHGGVGGRKIVPVYAPVDPLGTAGAATACSQLTQDDKVFVAMGFFQQVDTACYVQIHDTPIIGATLSPSQTAAARAPAFNTLISDSELVPKEMAIFKHDGVVRGQEGRRGGDVGRHRRARPRELRAQEAERARGCRPPSTAFRTPTRRHRSPTTTPSHRSSSPMVSTSSSPSATPATDGRQGCRTTRARTIRSSSRPTTSTSTRTSRTRPGTPRRSSRACSPRGRSRPPT